MIVADASVVFKWLVAEGGNQQHIARQLRDNYLSGNVKIVAPDILLYEIANIFVFKSNVSAHDAAMAWRTFLSLKVPVTASSPIFMTECLKLSIKYHITVYDAAYMVLAQKRHCDLITADAALVKKVHLPFVRHLNTYTKT